MTGGTTAEALYHVEKARLRTVPSRGIFAAIIEALPGACSPSIPTKERKTKNVRTHDRRHDDQSPHA